MTKNAGRVRCLLGVASLLFSLAACNRSGTSPDSQTQAPAGSVAADADPASGNLAPVSGAGAPQETSANYAQPDAGNAAYDLPADNQGYTPDSGYDSSLSDQPVEASDPPPPLPEYSQPPCPGDGYYWTPGYWGYADGGYYWVPGAWVLAPWVDALWTPPYWDYEGGNYRWHSGYWGPHIGFYGGIDYGFGYTGRGYYGAYWNNGSLNYNRSVTNVNVSVVHNVYNYAAPGGSNNRVSYNGGRGGLSARPTAQEMAVVRDPRSAPVSAQVQHQQQAAANRAQFASAGHAQPAALVAANPLPTSYKAPASKPPAAALRAAARPAPQAPAQGRPNEPQRVGPGQPAPAMRPVQENRPDPIAAPRSVPEARSAPQPAAATRPAPEARPAPVTRPTPAPEVRPTPQPVGAPRLTPEVRPAPAPEVRPAPVRPAPAPAMPRSAPEPRAAPQPAAAPRPAPAPAPRPAPEARPAPGPRPAPAPEPRPAPPVRPAPPQKEEKR